MQTLPQEQRFCGVTHQKWAVLGSKSHPCQGGVIPAQGVILGSPWQGAGAAICPLKSQLFGQKAACGSVFQQGKRMDQAEVNASILNNEQTHQGVCWSCLLTNAIVIETLCLLQDAK